MASIYFEISRYPPKNGTRHRAPAGIVLPDECDAVSERAAFGFDLRIVVHVEADGEPWSEVDPGIRTSW